MRGEIRFYFGRTFLAIILSSISKVGRSMYQSSSIHYVSVKYTVFLEIPFCLSFLVAFRRYVPK